jgi:predicted transcriptional regulator
MTTLQIQIPDSLHKRLQELADSDGISVDQFISTSVAEKISALMTQSYLESRGKRGTRTKYEAVLAQVLDVEPDECDKLPGKRP